MDNQNPGKGKRMMCYKDWLSMREVGNNELRWYVLNNIDIDAEKYVKREMMTEQFNIVHQMKNLFTYPFIKE
ncbi:MAG: hypothetical protein OH338_02860, partial [Candidatus Parvarchaeota archaeon]|nr:hypothetical protein [Candidatus Parvarchaeum tengchongense]